MGQVEASGPGSPQGARPQLPVERGGGAAAVLADGEAPGVGGARRREQPCRGGASPELKPQPRGCESPPDSSCGPKPLIPGPPAEPCAGSQAGGLDTHRDTRMPRGFRALQRMAPRRSAASGCFRGAVAVKGRSFLGRWGREGTRSARGRRWLPASCWGQGCWGQGGPGGGLPPFPVRSPPTRVSPTRLWAAVTGGPPRRRVGERMLGAAQLRSLSVLIWKRGGDRVWGGMCQPGAREPLHGASGARRGRADRPQPQDRVHLRKPPESAVRWGPRALRLLRPPAGARPSLRVAGGCWHRLPERGLGRQHPRPLGQHREAAGRGNRVHVQQGRPLVRRPQHPPRVPRPVWAAARELEGPDLGRSEGAPPRGMATGWPAGGAAGGL